MFTTHEVASRQGTRERLCEYPPFDCRIQFEMPQHLQTVAASVLSLFGR